MSSSSLFSRPSTVGMQRRPVAAQPVASNQMPSPAVIHPDIDPPPKPRALTQCLAVGFFIFLVLLQFLPVTHVRDPSDPRGLLACEESRLKKLKAGLSSKSSREGAPEQYFNICAVGCGEWFCEDFSVQISDFP
ncbi:uncharacterized protein LOC122062111 [Macadamia integrifolia]|uniref:uncharacterized protein LOC122062111 n=1 Tax=Macadamia integrifolia TaxID=60698 RepID=UPI001C5275DD|nr:uncharacterized protein LOC122062111 [Macadamia integrifolia]